MAEYCLRWNNHQPNLVTVFSELLTAESLVDVTLASDGHFIHAHKLVLSACSVYFKDLFGSNPCKHPIVFLKDIRIEDLKTVIDFIYRGEVNVSQERLQDVLKTAESLRIKGLADKPFSYDEYPSQNRGQHLSSSFSSQRSSLTDSRDQTLSVDADDLADASGNSPPVSKKRKVATSRDSSESVQDATNHEGEEKQQQQGKDGKDDPPKKLNDEVTIKAPQPASSKEKVKEENDGSAATITTEPRPEYQESRAADAMLMLQGSSSEGGGEEGGGNAAPPSSNARADSAASLISQHSQGRNKRAVLQRQSGILREGAAEEPQEDAEPCPEYIVPDSITLTLTTDSPSTACSSGTDSFLSLTSGSLQTTCHQSGGGSKMLQVPTVVVGAHQDKSSSYSPYGGGGLQKPPAGGPPKPLLVVPTSAVCGPAQMTKQRSQPEMTRSYSEGVPPQIKKQPSHQSVLSYSTSTSGSPPEYSASTSSNQQQQQPMTLIPMHLIKKQRSSPGSLPSVSSSSVSSSPSPHLRPIQPKPPIGGGGGGDKDSLPLIQFTTSDEEVVGPYHPRFSRATSEEPPAMSRSLDLLSAGVGPAPFTQSVSQDTGLDGGLAFMNRIMSSHQSLSVPKLSSTSATGGLSSTSSSVAHSPVLREGPALGCNFCWNSQDNQGRVQRRKTKYHCPACRTNLCIVPCFHQYHNELQMKQDQHKQFKVLTKTSST